MIYLDHAASTPILDSTLEVLNESHKRDWQNCSSKHIFGKRALDKLTRCRTLFSKELNCNNDDLFFVSSVTEANNLFIKGSKSSLEMTYCFCEADHSSITNVITKQSDIRYILNFDNDYLFDLSQLSFEPQKSYMFFFSAVNSQSGISIDLERQIARIRKVCPDAIIAVDGSQLFARQVIDLKKIDLNFLSFSSHKIGGPKGIAGCYVKDSKQLTPLLTGGGQEGGLRSSTVALPLIIGFEETLIYWQREREQLTKKFNNLEQMLISGLTKELPEIIFPFTHVEHVAHIIMAVLPNISSDIIMRYLEMDNVIISSTSACSSKNKGSDKLFLALGIDPQHMKNVLRFSFAPSTTREELEDFIKILKIHYNSLVKLNFRKR